MRNLSERLKYRVSRIRKNYSSEGPLSAVKGTFSQFVKDGHEVLLYAWRRVRYPNGLIERNTNVGPMLLSYYDKGVSKALLRGEVREPVLVDLLKRELEPGMVGFDVGANIGYYVVLESRILGENGRIVACEPIPETAALLEKNIESYCRSNVTVERVAVSSYIGETQMSRSRSWNVSRVQRPGDDALNTDLITTPTITLDALATRSKMENIDFVRMDIEGHEIEATKGMTRVLTSKNLKLFVEVHNPAFDANGSQVKSWLSSLFDYGLKPRALTIGGTLEWVDDQDHFVRKIVSQKKSCVHVFLES